MTESPPPRSDDEAPVPGGGDDAGAEVPRETEGSRAADGPPGGRSAARHSSDKAQPPVLTGLPVPLADPTGGVPARQPTPDELPEVGKVKRAWRWWLTKAAKIATVQNRVFAWLTFYLGLWPVALWFKIRRQDRLDRNPRAIGDSGWNTRTDPIHTEIDRVRRPF